MSLHCTKDTKHYRLIDQSFSFQTKVANQKHRIAKTLEACAIWQLTPRTLEESHPVDDALVEESTLDQR